jgi:hypothetical protein
MVRWLAVLRGSLRSHLRLTTGHRTMTIPYVAPFSG